MEKDTVLLSLKDYTDLVEFKREVLAGKCVVSDFRDGLYPYRFYTESQLGRKFEELLETNQQHIEDYKKAIEYLLTRKNKLIDEKKSVIQEKDALIKSLATMSFWEFYKFRKNNRQLQNGYT